MRLPFSARILSGFSMNRVLLIALLAMLHMPQAANAEGGCPAGQYPQQGQGWQSCVPIPGNAGSQGRPAVIWQDHWQAVAADTPKGILGVSTGMLTADDAEATALSDCRAKGGAACSLEISFVNGCVAMAVGESRKNFRGASTKYEAESAAMSQCKSNDSGCRIYYSACSLPTRLQ